MRVDAGVSLVLYTSITVAFYLLGAAVLHARGLDVTNADMIHVLSQMFRQTFGEWTLRRLSDGRLLRAVLDLLRRDRGQRPAGGRRPGAVRRHAVPRRGGPAARGAMVLHRHLADLRARVPGLVAAGDAGAHRRHRTGADAAVSLASPPCGSTATSTRACAGRCGNRSVSGSRPPPWWRSARINCGRSRASVLATEPQRTQSRSAGRLVPGAAAKPRAGAGHARRNERHIERTRSFLRACSAPAHGRCAAGPGDEPVRRSAR